MPAVARPSHSMQGRHAAREIWRNYLSVRYGIVEKESRYGVIYRSATSVALSAQLYCRIFGRLCECGVEGYLCMVLVPGRHGNVVRRRMEEKVNCNVLERKVEMIRVGHRSVFGVSSKCEEGGGTVVELSYTSSAGVVAYM